ncbi:MAG: fused MFS/spermidine synthase [Verrucomicrobiales bacterium]|nr:fused MFS/spermidine synthase [Verrucomicrobiales bacterium]
MVRKLLAPLLFFLGGIAALSWQVLWHLDLSLALGVSAKGTALTVATVMAGITLGALWSGKRIEARAPEKPWVFYGMLESFVGLSGWLPLILMPAIESADAAIYQSAPFTATAFTAMVLALTIGPASFAMGATLPVIGVIAKNCAQPLSRFYAANTAGAAFGALLVAFFLIPNLGRIGAGFVLIVIQLAILGAAFALSRESSMAKAGKVEPTADRKPSISARLALTFAAATGFATFALEVSWFRLLRSAWLSTTDSFAIMLFVFLIALAIGAWLSRRIRKWGVALSVILGLAGMAILIATPILERFDLWGNAGGSYLGRATVRVLAAFCVMGLPVALIGVSLPWLLDEFRRPRDWARLYGINTIGAVVGSLVAGWILMGLLGPVRTSWLAGLVLTAVAVPAIRNWRGRCEILVPTLCLLAVAWWAESGIGKTRTQGPTAAVRNEHRVLASIHGPDVTTSVVQIESGSHVLFIDGYAATGEYGASSNYMDAMGRLPMLLHNNPRDALVICFGTGQTARAVLDENPERLTVVDVNPAVFEVAELFKSNGEVLKDNRVRVRAMDGRAWLRRSDTEYDVVTLEPMPPFFAGTNSLYSVEFYELIHNSLREDGFVAQWFPMHLMTPGHARAVAAAFVEVFPAAVLWIDPDNADAQGVPQQGILIGRKGDRPWDPWPGFERPAAGLRPLGYETVNGNVFLVDEELARYVEGAETVTDNNQVLSYGKDALHRHDISKRLFSGENMKELFELKQGTNPAP